MKRITATVLIAWMILASCGRARAETLPILELRQVAVGVKQPVQVLSQPGFPQRLLVVEQTGRIQIVENGEVLAEPFLDVSSRVESGGEKGLLSIAFHPKYQENRKVYLNFTAGEPFLRTVIAEFRVFLDGGRADPMTERQILTIEQPFSNHNGGQLAFGPDGMLYIGMGDGGSAFDPQNNAQSLESLLGKILRIEVGSSEMLYRSPSDNPFVADKSGRAEIWAVGFRNPWRFSFDRKTGELWAGDVGQDELEEIDLIKRGGNYGWKIFEGTKCWGKEEECNANKFIAPVHTYSHKDGSSITGGFVYRGKAIPGLDGIYLYADYVTGKVWGLRYRDENVVFNRELLSTQLTISALGEDSDGELYVVAHQEGKVFQIVAPN